MSLNLHHSPGPLRIAGRETSGLPHTLVAARTLLFRVYSEAYGDFDQETENARRLVACWNACEGISTENLEDNAPVLDLARRYNKAIRQRDQLLEALKLAQNHIDMGALEVSHCNDAEQIRAAILEGGAA